MNLNDMTLDDLKALEKDVKKAISSYEARQKQEALAELEKKAADLGFTLAELTGGKTKKVVAPKYRNPADASQTWTGRGRPPKWIVDFEAAGNTRDSALI